MRCPFSTSQNWVREPAAASSDRSSIGSKPGWGWVMRIRHLSIRNNRGIRELDWALPDENVICLAGSGDATKSTVLEAIRCVLHPQWNLVFDDADFYDCKPTNEICIEALLGDIPNEFRDVATYGYWLSGWDATLRQRHDDPVEGMEEVVRVRLSVGSNLEPSWMVVKDGDGEGHGVAAGRRRSRRQDGARSATHGKTQQLRRNRGARAEDRSCPGRQRQHEIPSAS